MSDSVPEFEHEEMPTIPNLTPSGKPLRPLVQQAMRDLNDATEEASNALGGLITQLRRGPHPPKVLFVDDDRPNLIVWRALCEPVFPVLTAYNGAEALDLLRKHEVGVVLADQRMPVMTGVDLLERVRRDHPGAVRILITAYADFPAAVDAVNRAHVWRFLRKPWDNEQLVETLREGLGLYERQVSRVAAE